MFIHFRLQRTTVKNPKLEKKQLRKRSLRTEMKKSSSSTGADSITFFWLFYIENYYYWKYVNFLNNKVPLFTHI